MRTQQAGDHPSERLSSGTVSAFEEALALVEQELEEERWALRGDEPSCVARSVLEAGSALAQAPILAALRHAGRVYREEQEAACLRTVDRLRADALAAEAALDEEAARWLGLLATALEEQDYSGLAI